MPTEDFAAQQDRATALLTGLMQRSSHEVKPLAEEAEPIDATNVAELPAAITRIRRREGKSFVIRRQIAELTHKVLCTVGFFCRGDDDRLFFFDRRDHLLYDLDKTSRRFSQLLATASGLNQTEPEFAFVQTHLQNITGSLSPTPIYSRAHYDFEAGRFHISDGLGGQYVRDRGEEWRFAANGEEVIFFTEPDGERWAFDRLATDIELQWFLGSASLADDENLSADDQRELFLTALLFLLFTRSIRPVPVGIGLKESGETTFFRFVGMLLTGSKFEVTGSLVDKPLTDVLVALSNSTVLVLDNFDSYVKGIEDLIATYATGAEYKQRTLYQNNVLFVIRLRGLMFITTRAARFNRDDVADRALPLFFKAPATQIGEDAFKQQLLLRRDAIMSGLLVRIAEIVDRLGYIKAPPLNFRLADFAAFGWVMHAAEEDGGWASPHWEVLLDKLKLAQYHFAAADNSIVAALRIVLEKESITKVPVAVLYSKCLFEAEHEHLSFPKSVNSFGRELSNLKSAIEAELGVVFLDDRSHADRRFISLTPKSIDLYPNQNSARAKYA